MERKFNGFIFLMNFVLFVSISSLVFAFYGCHLLGECSFTFDFAQGYHSIDYYVIEHLRRGLWPEWAAHQSAGYPVYMHLQSALYYPITWIIAAFNIDYSLHFANIFQVAHICFGAVGAYVLSKNNNLSKYASIWVGICYFLMGGFYDGSQHIDIIRGYCYTPWCLAALNFKVITSDSNFFWRFLVFVGFFTGAYPGQVISSFLIFPSYVLIQFFIQNKCSKKNNLNKVFIIFLVLGMAGAFSLPKYMPFVIDFASEVTRSSDIASMARSYLEPIHLFSLVLNSTDGIWPSDITLRTYYVGPVVFLFFFLLNWRRVGLNELSWILFLFLLLVLATGVLLKISEHFKYLGFSRFPIADFKSFIVLAIIILAGINLDKILNAERNIRFIEYLLIASFFIVFITTGVSLTDSKIFNDFWISLISVIILGGVLFLTPLFYSIGNERRIANSSLSKYCFIFSITIIQIACAYAIHFESPVWRDFSVKDTSRYMLGYDIFDKTSSSDGIFEVHSKRPARIVVESIHSYSGRGFYSGEYVLKGYDASKDFKKHDFLWNKKLIDNDKLIGFFKLPGCAISFENLSENQEPFSFFQIKEDENLSELCVNSPVQQTKYSSVNIEYEVKNPNEKIIFENEIAWNGWSAKAFLDNGSVMNIEMIPEFYPYRAWKLPNGTNKLVVSYEDSNFWKIVSFSIILFILFFACYLIVKINWRFDIKSV